MISPSFGGFKPIESSFFRQLHRNSARIRPVAASLNTHRRDTASVLAERTAMMVEVVINQWLYVWGGGTLLGNLCRYIVVNMSGWSPMNRYVSSYLYCSIIFGVLRWFNHKLLMRLSWKGDDVFYMCLPYLQRWTPISAKKGTTGDPMG